VEPAEVGAAYDLLAEQARAHLVAEGVDADRVQMEYAMDMRYVGQTHELRLNLPGPYDDEMHECIPRLFGELHQAEFGHAPELGEPLDFVNLRVAGIGKLDRPELPEIPEGGRAAPHAHREVFFGGADGWVSTPIYHRGDLGHGDRIQGPAIIEQLDSTTVITPGWTAEPDRVGSLILRHG